MACHVMPCTQLASTWMHGGLNPAPKDPHMLTFLTPLPSSIDVTSCRALDKRIGRHHRPESCSPGLCMCQHGIVRFSEQTKSQGLPTTQCEALPVVAHARPASSLSSEGRRHPRAARGSLSPRFGGEFAASSNLPRTTPSLLSH